MKLRLTLTTFFILFCYIVFAQTTQNSNGTGDNINGNKIYIIGDTSKSKYDSYEIYCRNETRRMTNEINDLLAPYIDGKLDIDSITKNRIVNIIYTHISNGADVNTDFLFGIKPIYLSIECESLLLLGLLLQKDVQLDFKDKLGVSSPLMVAIDEDLWEYAEYLIQAGANVNVKNDDNETPLLLAAKSGNYNTVDLLLKKGADAKFINDEGYSILDILNISMNDTNYVMTAKLKSKTARVCTLLTERGAIHTKKYTDKYSD